MIVSVVIGKMKTIKPELYVCSFSLHCQFYSGKNQCEHSHTHYPSHAELDKTDPYFGKTKDSECICATTTCPQREWSARVGDTISYSGLCIPWKLFKELKPMLANIDKHIEVEKECSKKGKTKTITYYKKMPKWAEEQNYDL